MRPPKSNTKPVATATSRPTQKIHPPSHEIRKRCRRLLLVDTHTIGLAALKLYLAGRTNFQVATLGLDRIEALDHAKTKFPDLVLINLRMSGFDGADVTRLLLQAAPASRVVGFNGTDDRQSVLSMLRAGARGYVLTSCTSSELVQALETVHRGDLFFSPTILRLIAEECAFDRARPEEIRRDNLSEREQRIVALIADGCSNKEIADQLKASVRTIEKHRERLMAKLRIRTVSGLTKFAIRLGITSLE